MHGVVAIIKEAKRQQQNGAQLVDYRDVMQERKSDGREAKRMRVRK